MRPTVVFPEPEKPVMKMFLGWDNVMAFDLVDWVSYYGL